MSDEWLIPRVDLDFGRTLEEWRSAFVSVPKLEFLQAWRETVEPGFRPGVARIGWTSQSFWVLAELEDESFVNRATGLNQRTWELGDVLEIFIKTESEVGYYEFHITPDNHHLQLRFPKPGLVFMGMTFETYMLEGELIRSQVWPFPEEKRWAIGVEIPMTLFNESLCEGSRIRFSISRYDFTEGQPRPVLSSTSPLQAMRFHRVENWRVGRLVE